MRKEHFIFVFALFISGLNIEAQNIKTGISFGTGAYYQHHGLFKEQSKATMVSSYTTGGLLFEFLFRKTDYQAEYSLVTGFEIGQHQTLFLFDTLSTNLPTSDMFVSLPMFMQLGLSHPDENHTMGFTFGPYFSFCQQNQYVNQLTTEKKKFGRLIKMGIGFEYYVGFKNSKQNEFIRLAVYSKSDFNDFIFTSTNSIIKNAYVSGGLKFTFLLSRLYSPKE